MVTVWSRLQRSGDDFWEYWPTAAAWVVAVGAFVSWNTADRTAQVSTGTVLLSAVVVGLGAKWPVLRLWMGAALLASAAVIGLETWGYSSDVRTVVWGLLGLALIAASFLWRSRPAGHLAAIGHLMSTGAAIADPSGGEGAIVFGAWALGWIISVVAAETGGASLTAVLARAAERAAPGSAGKLAALAKWPVAILTVATVPPAVLTAAELWDDFADNRSWTGVALAAVALAYAGTAVRVRERRPLSRILAFSAIATSVIGVAVAAPG